MYITKAKKVPGLGNGTTVVGSRSHPPQHPPHNPSTLVLLADVVELTLYAFQLPFFTQATYEKQILYLSFLIHCI